MHCYLGPGFFSNWSSSSRLVWKGSSSLSANSCLGDLSIIICFFFDFNVFGGDIGNYGYCQCRYVTHTCTRNDICIVSYCDVI